MPGDPVEDACQTLATYLPRLQALLPEPSTDHTKVATYTRPVDPPLPWNTPAGNAYMTIWEGIRRLLASLRATVTGHTGIRPGSSEENTTAVLAAIPKIAAGLSQEQRDVTTHILSKWINQAKTVPGIDEAKKWRALPKRQGEGLPPRCPHCGCYQLRVDVDSRVVACFVPGCEDGNGQPPVATMTIGTDGCPQLAWADGITEMAPDMDLTPG